MLTRDEFMPVNYLKKEAYTGSHRGMRYRMWKGEADEKTVLWAAAWPEPYGFEATAEEARVQETFEFSEAGICEAVQWLNLRYETDYQEE